MKKIVYAFLLFSGSVFSQNTTETPVVQQKVNLRHITGFHGIDVTAGLNKYGQQFSLGLTQYESEKFMARIILNSEFGKVNLTSYNTNTIFIELNHTLFKLKDAIFFNVGYGAVAGWETTSNEVLSNKTETLEYGLLVDVNAEIYLLNRLALLMEFKEIWDNGSNLGAFRYYANTGIRFYL